MVQRTSEKISEMDAATQLSSAAIIPVTDGNASYRIAKPNLLGYLDVRDYGASPSATAAANVTALTAAVAAAFDTGAMLWWPPGAYSTNATIPLLHSARHRGPGRIVRGSDTFYVEPQSVHTNRLYLSPTGSAAADGLSSSQPMLTPQNAFDALANYGPSLNGTWRVVCAAGTWAGTVHRNQLTTPSKNPVVIEGPDVGGHPNVPTAIFDGTLNPAADDWAISGFGDGVQIELRDLKAQNYVGLSDSNGFYCECSTVTFSNLHSSGHSFAALYLQGCTRVRGGGGIWAASGGNTHGAYVNGCVNVTFGYGSVPIRINGPNVGVEWARGTEGHIDYCEFNDCAYAVDIFHNARAHLLSNNFKRSTVAAVNARPGGYYTNTTNTFNDGGADANAINLRNYAFAGQAEDSLWNAYSEVLVGFDYATYTHSGTTTETTIVSPYTIPANTFETKPKRLRIECTGQFTTATAPTRVGVKFGATSMDLTQLTGSPAANSIFRYTVIINAMAGDSQSVFTALEYDGCAAPVITSFSRTADTDADSIVSITFKLNNAADTAKLYSVDVWRTG